MPVPEGLPLGKARLLQPPTPIIRTDNWPLLPVTGKSAFEAWAEAGAPDTEGVIPNYGGGVADAYNPAEEDMDASGWDDDLDLGDDHKPAGGEAAGGGGGGWDDDDELDLGGVDDHHPKGGEGGLIGDESGGSGGIFVPPPPGTACTAHWCDNSSHAGDHAAAGSFETAMQLLHRQIAAVEFAPLRAQFTAAYTGAYASLPGLPLAPSLRLPLQRNSQDRHPGKASLPALALRLPPLIEDLKSAYRAFHAGACASARLSGVLASGPVACCSLDRTKGTFDDPANQPNEPTHLDQNPKQTQASSPRRRPSSTASWRPSRWWLWNPARRPGR